MKPLVSVIIPVYMVEKYIDDCIKSIVEQTYTNIEIILVNDGSKDLCPQICDEWEKRDSRIKVIHKRNGGLSDARNAGLDKSRGEYIAFLDSDDFVSPKWIEEMLDAALNYDADVVVCGRYIYRDGECFPVHCLSELKLFSPEQAIREILLGRQIEEATWDKLYRKELFCYRRFPVGEINEDVVTIPYIIEQCKTICHVGTPLYYYRQTATGITKSRYNMKKSVYIKHIKEIKNFVEKKYPQLKYEVSVFMGRYSYALLLQLSLNKTDCKKYKNDYKIYLKFLRQNTRNLLKADHVSAKDKIQILLIDCQLYPFLIRLKNKMFRSASNR